MINFTRLVIVLIFRLICWCLVTGSFERNNLIIGVVIVLLIPFGDFRKLQLRALVPEILLTLRLPFDMLKESIQLISIKTPSDQFIEVDVSSRTRHGSRFAQFLDLFRITFTPMTLVTARQDKDTWRVHRVAAANPSISGDLPR